MEAKKWHTSKGFWLGVIICLGGVAEYLSGLPEGISISTMIAGVLAVIIRFLTKQPISR